MGLLDKVRVFAAKASVSPDVVPAGSHAQGRPVWELGSNRERVCALYLDDENELTAVLLRRHMTPQVSLASQLHDRLLTLVLRR